MWGFFSMTLTIFVPILHQIYDLLAITHAIETVQVVALKTQTIYQYETTEQLELAVKTIPG